MKVMLVDDHPLFLDGLATLLTVRGIDVAGTARSGAESVQKARALRPDLILMDLNMPGMNGVAATRLIAAESRAVKVALLTMSVANDRDVFETLKVGAWGYLLKTQETEDILGLLQSLHRGEVYLTPGVARLVLAELADDACDHSSSEPGGCPERLSARQREVLTLLAQGVTYDEAARRTGVARSDIGREVGEIIERLHDDICAEAVP